MPMLILLHCRRCHREFRLTADRLRAGAPGYWYCDACRPQPASDERHTPQATKTRVAN
jgi:hypothetical protein